jgi:hypothetical protein
MLEKLNRSGDRARVKERTRARQIAREVDQNFEGDQQKNWMSHLASFGLIILFFVMGAIASCVALPIVVFFAFRGRFGVATASAIAASYGSVSQ